MDLGIKKPLLPDEAVDIVPPPPLHRGLQNLGNTCYVSSSLQMLCTANDFVSSIKGKGGPLSESVVDVAQQLENRDQPGPVDPTAVKEAMKEVSA